MPIYVYVPEDAGAEEGAEVERFYHADPPDTIFVNGAPHVRTSVVRISVATGSCKRSQGEEVLAGYHAQECAMGSRFRSRYSADQIRDAWKDDQLSAIEKADDVAQGTVNEAVS